MFYIQINYSQHSLSRHPLDLTKNVEVSECQHKRRQRNAYKFILCLMYKLCMFNVCLWKMYVVVRTSVCVCKRDKFIRDRVFDNNVYNHLFKV